MAEKSLSAEGLQHLKSLIRFDTTNPPGNEMPAALYLQDVLKKEGFAPEVIESAPGRGNVVARLAGDGSEKPLLLFSHLDVVPAQAGKWEVDPFAAEEKDGCLYGRGTLDMKQMTAMSLMSIIRLKRKQAKLKRDVIFAAVADEEAGGQKGAGYLVENRPELLEAQYALCEMGGFRMEIKGQVFFPVQVAERGCAWCRARFEGEPGHGSIPNPDSAVSKLGRALVRLEKKGLRFQLTEPVKDFVDIVSAQQKAHVRTAMRALLNPHTGSLALKLLPKEQARLFYAQLHSTAVPTVLKAGEKENVIPSEAEVGIDGRVLPGQTWEDFKGDLQKALGKEAVIELVRWMEPLVYPTDTELFDVIQRVILEREQDAVVVPYLLTAFTDAKHLDKLGIITYGFSPMKNDLQEKISGMIHGHNERIGLDAFAWGVDVLAEVVEKFCATPSSKKAVDALMDEMIGLPGSPEGTPENGAADRPASGPPESDEQENS